MTSNPLTQGKSNTAEFLKPTHFIDCEHPEIAEKARELTKVCRTDAERVRVLFEFVRDSHNDNHCESFVASEVLKCGGNSCRQRSILLAALCRAVGIPARLHLQKVTIRNWRNSSTGEVADIAFAHGITGIYLDGEWHLYESVGNREKWIVWTGDESRGAEMPIRFHPDRDCLFKPDEDIAIETLAMVFADRTAELVEMIEQIDRGE